MASASRDQRGNAVVQFVGIDGKRRSIRLGKISDARVEVFRQRIEQICVAKKHRHVLDGETAEWIIRLSDDFHARLSAVGLTTPRGSAQLGTFLDAYTVGRTDLDDRTVLNMRTEANRLKAYFGVEEDIRAITEADADNFVVWMKTEGYAEATTARNIKRARQFFQSAMRGKLLAENPFAHIKPGSMTNDERQFHVTKQDAYKVIEQCPNHQWRLIVALSRFGGLRCPSEHLTLEWTDFDWERNRFTVRAPKTGDRVVPIFSELMPYLRESFEMAEPGAVNVITIKRSREANLRTTLVKYIRRAGLAPWERPFHNMRASRQTELVADFPAHVVCAWLGNSEHVAKRHYLTVREEDFERASQRAAKSGAVTHFTGCTGEQDAIELATVLDKTTPVKPMKRVNTDEIVNQYPRQDSNL